MKDRYTKRMVVSISDTGSPNQIPEYVSLINEDGSPLHLSNTIINKVLTSGTNQTLPSTTIAQINDLTLTAGICTLTFPSGSEGDAFRLILRQGSGNNTVVWPTVRWPFDVIPTLSSIVGAIDELSFLFIAGQWRGNLDVSYTS